MSATYFRGMVVIWALLYVWWSTLPSSAFDSPAVLAAMEHMGRGAIVPLNETMANLFLLAGIVAAAGLLFFRAWGRTVLLFSTILSVVLAPFTGIVVSGPVDGTLGFAMTLLTGALLALAFWSPLAQRFVREGRAANEAQSSASAELVIVYETSDPAALAVVHSLLASAAIGYTTTSGGSFDGITAGDPPAAGRVRFFVRGADALVAKDVIELGYETSGKGTS